MRTKYTSCTYTCCVNRHLGTCRSILPTESNIEPLLFATVGAVQGQTPTQRTVQNISKYGTKMNPKLRCKYQPVGIPSIVNSGCSNLFGTKIEENHLQLFKGTQSYHIICRQHPLLPCRALADSESSINSTGTLAILSKTWQRIS